MRRCWSAGIDVLTSRITMTPTSVARRSRLGRASAMHSMASTMERMVKRKRRRPRESPVRERRAIHHVAAERMGISASQRGSPKETETVGAAAGMSLDITQGGYRAAERRWQGVRGPGG